MKNPKLFLFIIGIILALAATAYFEHKGRLRQKADRIRLQENQRQFMLQDSLKYVLLVQTIDEFKKTISPRIDSLLKADKIKPKQVTNVTNVYNTYNNRDTSVITPDPTITGRDTSYKFDDTKDCFRVAGYMLVSNNKPSLIITERDFENEIDLIAYWTRKHKFLGIPFGKKLYTGKATADCGKVRVKEIEIKKNKRD